MPHYKYDVAVSFAGEDRSIVEECVRLLTDAGYHVFYDLWEEHVLLGKDLYQYLDTVYRSTARYCLIFVSKNYVKKAWATHELRSAQARAFEEESEYILPVRLDDTVLPGLRPTIGYLDLRRYSTEHVVSVLVRKLGPARSQQEIEQDLVSPDAARRLKAITRVASEKDSSYLERLGDILRSDSDSQIRARAAWALDNICDVRAKSVLLEALTDVDWNVRSNAGWALVHLGANVKVDVRKIATQSQNRGAREMAHLVLERI